MLGRVPRQAGLFEAGNLYLDHVGVDSLYAGLAELGSVYFKDDDFADFYRDGGRPSVPPSRLCLLLFLQYIHGVSDSEAVNRAAYDLRWKVALGLG
jgi:transposase